MTTPTAEHTYLESPPRRNLLSKRLAAAVLSAALIASAALTGLLYAVGAAGVVRSDQVPEATSVLKTLRRVGGWIGTALLAVMVAHQARATLGSSAASTSGLLQTLSPTVRAHVAAPLASAFADTFWWTLGATLIALMAACVLGMTQRREHRATAARKLEPVAT